MIVISGALLVIAVVFLGIGLEGALAWVYASIVVSFLAFVFMLIALRQQRKAAWDDPAPPAHPLGGTKRPEPDAAPAGAEAADGDVTLVTPQPAAGPNSEDTAATDGNAAVPTPSSAPAEAPTTTTDVPLVPATRKSAARKSSAATAAKKTTATKKTAVGTPVATESAAEASDSAPPRKRAPRKAAAKKAVPAEGDKSNQLAMTDPQQPTEPAAQPEPAGPGEPSES